MAIQSLVSSQAGGIGYVRAVINREKQVENLNCTQNQFSTSKTQRTRREKKEKQTNALAIKERKIERGLQDFISVEQLVILLSCQLVCPRRQGLQKQLISKL